MSSFPSCFACTILSTNSNFIVARRWPECIDYSEVIRSWASDPRRQQQMGPFTTRSMEEVTVGDLTLRLGHPYVYVHQGEHEHLISFTDARLMGVNDEPSLAKYPIERCVATKHSKYCMVCSVDIARWITTDNDRVRNKSTS